MFLAEPESHNMSLSQFLSFLLSKGKVYRDLKIGRQPCFSPACNFFFEHLVVYEVVSKVPISKSGLAD